MIVGRWSMVVVLMSMVKLRMVTMVFVSLGLMLF